MKIKDYPSLAGYGNRNAPIIFWKGLIMRLFCILTLLTTLLVSGFATTSRAQRVTIHHSAEPLKTVLDDLRRQTGYSFFITDALLDRAGHVSIVATDADLRDVLDMLTQQVDYAYSIKGDKQYIVIKAKKQSSKVIRPSENLILALQQIIGRVTDTLGQPLAGASIRVINADGQPTTLQTTTDRVGEFRLHNVPEDAVIEISYVGYLAQTVKTAANIGTIVLRQLPSALEEVEINAGYYTVKDRGRTGSISRVSGKEIELQPIVSPLEALQGRMAGVEIQQPDGMPGSAPIIRIRGTNSLREEGNYPLYIIDGIPINSTPVGSVMGFSGPGPLLSGQIDPLSTLNLSNIESIEILKDADATAIYGSRGANGVVLITTRKGQGYYQKTQFEVGWYSGVGQVGRKMELLNTKQYVALRKAAMANAGVVPDANRAPDIVLWDTTRNTDWQEELLGGTAPMTNISLSASGGNTNTSFRLNGSFRKQGNVFPEEIEYKKATVGLRLNHRSTNEKLNLNLVLNYGTDQSNSFAVQDIVKAAYLLPPNAPALYQEDGSLNWEKWGLFYWDNPLATKYNTVDAEIRNLLTNFMLSYNLLPGLTLKSSFGYSRNTRETLGKGLRLRLPPGERDYIEDEARKGVQKRSSWIIEPQLTYKGSFGIGNIDALVGSTLQKDENDGVGIRGVGFVSEALIGDMSSANQYYSIGGRFTEYKYNAIFGRLGYNWSHKYFINLTGRRDGSSRFGPGKQFSNFGAIGVAWIFSEESLVKKHMPFLSFGKLRGSYGITGSDQIGDYQYLDSYEATRAPEGLYPTALFNPDFAWEENKKLESALELAFLNDRINTSISWYRNRSSNQLVGYPLPAMTGYTSVQANLPATVQNTGWELALTTTNMQAKNFFWRTSVNISFPKNKLIAFPGIEQTSYAYSYKVGYPLSIVSLYQYDGIDPETGFYKIRDVNDDGSYNSDDRVVIKNAGRKYYGGINNSFSFKGFTCSFLWDFIKQESSKGEMFTLSAPGYSGGNYNRAIEDYTLWESGELYIEDSTPFNRSYIRAQASDYGWVDASFIRLKTLSLSYDIAPHLRDKIRISKFRLLLSAQNLLTISSYAGINLESGLSGRLRIPALRVITGGVQIQF